MSEILNNNGRRLPYPVDLTWYLMCKDALPRPTSNPTRPLQNSCFHNSHGLIL